MFSHGDRLETDAGFIVHVAILALHLRVTVRAAQTFRIQMNVVRKLQT